MTLLIYMDLDNAAFEEDPRPEVARILFKLACYFKDRAWKAEEFSLRDINGNTVGRVEFVED